MSMYEIFRHHRTKTRLILLLNLNFEIVHSLHKYMLAVQISSVMNPFEWMLISQICAAIIRTMRLVWFKATESELMMHITKMQRDRTLTITHSLCYSPQFEEILFHFFSFQQVDLGCEMRKNEPKKKENK